MAAGSGLGTRLAFWIMASLDNSFTENTFGDLSYTFLEPVPNYLTCIICYGLLKEAVATDCCAKMFCCEHSSRTEQICPACRHEPLSVSRNRGIDSIVKDLKVFCPKHKKGCQWSGHLCFEPEHRVACGYVSVPCEKECGVKVQRRFMKSHLTEECRLRELDCEFCDFKGTAADMTVHLETCPEYPIICPHGCELQLPRKGLNDHSSTCSEAPVPCPFAGAGCDVMSVKRKELAGHLETSVGAHLLLLATSNQCLTEEVVELKKEREGLLERSKKEAASLEKVSAELQEVKAELQQVKMEVYQVKGEVHRMIESERPNKAASVTNVEVSKYAPISRVSDHRLFKPVGFSDDGLSDNGTSNSQDGWEEEEVEEEEEEEEEEEDEEEEEEEEEYSSQSSGGRSMRLGRVFRVEQRSWVEDIYNSSISVITEWGSSLILKYQNVGADMITDNTWNSRRFTDNEGYEMCLCVTPNGIKQAKGCFVSVQMQIMPGEHDDMLEWPCNAELDVEILNPHGNYNHCRKTMDFTSFPHECVCEPDGWNSNEPWGILRFLNHNQLLGYLWNDTLYFRVSNA